MALISDTKKAFNIRSLKKRADFLRLRHAGREATKSSQDGFGAKYGRPAFLLQVAPSSLPKANTIRVGYTVTKKMGNAVTRNRIKRRLRAAMRDSFRAYALAECDYVLLARSDAAHCSHDTLIKDLEKALQKTTEALNSRQSTRKV